MDGMVGIVLGIGGLIVSGLSLVMKPKTQWDEVPRSQVVFLAILSAVDLVGGFSLL